MFKAGRARNVYQRLQQYPKGSQLVARVPVSLMVDAESMMLKLCGIKFTQRKDFGKEYFQGNVSELMGAMLIAAAFSPIITDVPFDESTESDEIISDDEFLDEVVAPSMIQVHTLETPIVDIISHTSRDPTALYLQYININRSVLGEYVDSVQLLEKIIAMYRSAGCNASLTLRSMLRDLKHYYKCTESPDHVFSDGNKRHAYVSHPTLQNQTW